MESDVFLAENLQQEMDYSDTENSYKSATEADMETDA